MNSLEKRQSQTEFKNNGIKKDTCYDEHWVLYTINELLNTASKPMIYCTVASLT